MLNKHTVAEKHAYFYLYLCSVVFVIDFCVPNFNN